MPAGGSPSPLTPPEQAGLVLSFVNTAAGDRDDELADADGLRDWLEGAGYPDTDVTDADAAVVREVRDCLQLLMLAHSGDDAATPDREQAAETRLARTADQVPLRLLITATGVSLQAPGTGMWAALGAVLAGVADLDRAGVWERVKACRNDICHAGFFDRSRNGSAVYHGPNCASMVSMRAYRQRKKGDQG